MKDGEVIVTPETITTYTRDAAGRTLAIRRDIGAMTTTESTEYDILGRVTRQTDILGRVTTTAYSEDGLTTTTTTPAGATTITLRNTDGSTQSISGTAQRELHYSYTRNGNNLATTVTLADGSILSQNFTNGNGQTILTATPNTLGGFIYTRSEYNAKGHRFGTETTAPMRYEYDSFGNLISPQTQVAGHRKMNIGVLLSAKQGQNADFAYTGKAAQRRGTGACRGAGGVHIIHQQ